MLFAERHRKLGRDGSLAHDRAEDLLTSTAFQLLRYLSVESGLLAVLRRVRAVQADGQATQTPPPWLNLDGVTGVDYEFWPQWPGFGQPDVVVTMLRGNTQSGRLVIEVKLDSGKSGDTDEEDAAETQKADQLWRYWQGLGVDTRIKRLGVVYLTTHAAPPTEEMRESVAHEPGHWLGWLSWRDVWLEMNENTGDLPARDLAEILAAKGLNAFDGFFRCETPSVPANAVFWSDSGLNPSRWFCGPPYRPGANPMFWSGSIR